MSQTPARNDPPPVELALVRLDPGLPVPGYAHPGDAGADLCSTVDVRLEPGQRVTVPTGVAIALPEGYAGFVHPRSEVTSEVTWQGKPSSRYPQAPGKSRQFV